MISNRRDQILQLLAEAGSLTVEQAAARLSASPATVRRDFNRLAQQNLVQRVRGGVRMLPNVPSLPLAVREVRHRAEKMAIAHRAAQLFGGGDVVFIDGGSTTLQLSEFLPVQPLRIITNSLHLAAAVDARARNRATLELFLTGGFLFPHSGLLVGPRAVSGLGNYHAHWAMLSAGGVNEAGIFNDNEHVVESERVMIANADRVAVLADHSKIGKQAMCHICPLEKIDLLITNTHPDTAAALRHLEDHGLKILCVSAPA